MNPKKTSLEQPGRATHGHERFPDHLSDGTFATPSQSFRCAAFRRLPGAMSFYKDNVYPLLVDRFGNPSPIQALRRAIVPRACGAVLEIGVGSGVNFQYYDPSRVNRLYALEPNAGMRRLAEERQHRTTFDVEFLSLPGERIPLQDASIDTVVSTFTLCTIAAVQEALSDLARVLKPRGVLLFLENSVAEDIRVRKWQRSWEPIHRRVFEGLFLTRDIPALIAHAGFEIERVDRVYLSRFPKSWSHCCYGAASNGRRGARR